MPAYRNKVIFEVSRGVKAFLNLEAGLVRGEAPLTAGTKKVSVRGLRRKALQVARGNGTVVPDRVRPENIIWVFGSGRTGSSWLSRMMGGLDHHFRWNEPYLGELFGRFYENHSRYRIDKHFVMADNIKYVWLTSMRNLVLDEAAALFPDAVDDGYVVIKEPHGALGASLLMEALPESRIVLLIRDPRDVTASTLDAHRKKGWSSERLERKGVTDLDHRAENNPDQFVMTRATSYMQDIDAVRSAYDAHQGHKTLVLYEDLRADTLNVMKRIYNDIQVPVREQRLTKTVERLAWKNVREEDKGEGKIYRKAKPGGWREDLTPEQIETINEIAAPLIEEFYPDLEP